MSLETFVPKAALEKSIKLLHDSDVMAVLAATGAGAGLQQLLWGVAGSSRTLIDAQFPYSHAALADFLRGPVERTGNRVMALRMASAAYDRAVALKREAERAGRPLAVEHPRLVGLGITAAVATDRARRGEDRFHIALRSEKGFRCVEHVFTKGDFSREEEGEIVDLVALCGLFLEAGVSRPSMHSPIHPFSHGAGFELLKSEPVPEADFFKEPLFLPDGARTTAGILTPNESILFPGSFNPLHEGHLLMADVVQKQTGRGVVFLITATHPDKGALPVDELWRRKAQFDWRAPVLFTQGDGLYVEKARRFPGFAFLVGADAVKGLLDTKYYGGEAEREDVLIELHELGTRFYVAGRKNPKTDEFETLDDLVIPHAFARLFIPVQARLDLSSTEIRAAK